MTRALLLVDHGSRHAEAHAHLERLASRIAELAPDWQVQVAHLELAEPSIPDGIDACVRAGAREVRVLPLFLLPGRHLRHDIPALVRAAVARHRDVEIRLAESLGQSPELAELILRRALA
jgi:sirohydrochlorin ferrochelatase